jgi:hypothetical protein
MLGFLLALQDQAAHQRQLLSRKRLYVPTMAVAHALIAMPRKRVGTLMLKSFALRVYPSKSKKCANFSLALPGRHQWVDGV